MSEDYFYGCTLSATNKEVKWEPDELKENGAGEMSLSLSPRGEHCLSIKQAILDGAPDGEVNIVEVETSGYKSQIKLPIIVLVGGKREHTVLDLNFPDPPVTLRLLKGSGPIHIAGNHIITSEQFNDDDDDDDDLDDIDEEDEEEEAGDDVTVKSEPTVAVKTDSKSEDKGKKRVNSSPQAQQSKKKRGAKDD